MSFRNELTFSWQKSSLCKRYDHASNYIKCFFLVSRYQSKWCPFLVHNWASSRSWWVSAVEFLINLGFNFHSYWSFYWMIYFTASINLSRWQLELSSKLIRFLVNNFYILDFSQKAVSNLHWINIARTKKASSA